MNHLNSFEIREGHTTNDRVYTGLIEKIKLNRKLEYYRFDYKCMEDFSVYLESEMESTLYICINLSLKNSLNIECSGHAVSVPSFASLLIPSKEAKKLYLNGGKGESYDFVILRIVSSHLDEEQMQLLNSINDESSFFAKNTKEFLIPNLSICEWARKLKNINKSSCEDKFIASGYSNIIIGLKLKEFLNSENLQSKLGYLRGYEINELELLTDQIKKNPENQYSISELCKQTGLSVSKLQAGFKDMHDCTVAIFIRNVRLDNALELLKNTDLNVSEIVYSVGLNSRSYFCRIFKKRYKCSPKSYQQKLKMSMLAVS